MNREKKIILNKVKKVGYFLAFIFIIMLAEFIILDNKKEEEVLQVKEACNETINTIYEQNEFLLDKSSYASEQIIALCKITKELDTDNTKLIKDNKRLQKVNKKLLKREELFDKYEAYLWDEEGKRTDITYSELETLEEKLKKSKIQDADFILSVAMTESGGDRNCTSDISTAKGYGQFLDGTSKFVYCDLMGNSDWDSSIAYDGKTNFKMMVEYFDYLLKINNRSMIDALRYYRGKQDIEPYMNRVNYYMKRSDKNKNVQALATKLKR